MASSAASRNVDGKGGDSLPGDTLRKTAEEHGVSVLSEAFARLMDTLDPLASFREKFHIPLMKDLPCVKHELVDLESECVYLSGQSLGLQPKSAEEYMTKSLENWKKRGVLSHFDGYLPAAFCDLPGLPATARIVGAKPEEIALMNGLTVNLHLLLVSFYRPTPARHKILMEDNAFPSDKYAAKSQILFHGYKPEESLLYIKPRKSEYVIRNEDIIDYIEREGDSIALVLFPGVQYFTGQKFDIKEIAEAAHKKGCVAGFDVAHSIGNVALELHQWEVDFACWCSYKYLNSGSGGIAGIFIHEKHFSSSMPKFHGWWSNIAETRLEMKEDADLAVGAAGLRISNPPPWLATLNLASLEIFEAATMENITSKQFLLTGYLELLLIHYFVRPETGGAPLARIITPHSPNWRGAQLSVTFLSPVASIQQELERRGILVDIRKDTVMRVAPVPLYNSFHDVFRFIQVLKKLLTNTQTD